MPAERFFISHPLSETKQLSLEGSEFHHLIHVMRAKEGDSIELVNGVGELATLSIFAIEKKRALLQVETVIFEAKPTFEVILAQAVPRTNRLDFILEKGTELGMTQLWLFSTARSEKKTMTDQQVERMQAVTISAMKQCGRLYLPSITVKQPLSFGEKAQYPIFFGDVDPAAPSLIQAWQTEPPQGGVIFYIGPEGGFTEKETKKILANGGRGVKLHNNILRTDTAALSALSLVHHLMSFH